MEEEKKDCMFQCGSRYDIWENTGLITRKEAEALWEKHLETIKDNWDELSSPQMCIWVNCTSDTDYGEVGKDIDFRDCVLENGNFYRVDKKLIE
jgi:hypothetical protein